MSENEMTPEQTQENLGIENIKDVLTFSIGMGLKVADYLEDGKISVPEGLALALKIPAALKTGKQIKAAFQEIKDLSPDELGEIMTLVINMIGVEVAEDDQ